MLANQLLALHEEIDLVSDSQNCLKVIQKELARQKIKLKNKIKSVKLPDEKKVIFNQSSGGGNISIESENVELLIEDGTKMTGRFVIYISFRNEVFNISYNFFVISYQGESYV